MPPPVSLSHLDVVGSGRKPGFLRSLQQIGFDPSQSINCIEDWSRGENGYVDRGVIGRDEERVYGGEDGGTDGRGTHIQHTPFIHTPRLVLQHVQHVHPLHIEGRRRSSSRRRREELKEDKDKEEFTLKQKHMDKGQIHMKWIYG